MKYSTQNRPITRHFVKLLSQYYPMLYYQILCQYTKKAYPSSALQVGSRSTIDIMENKSKKLRYTIELHLTKQL